MILFKFEKKNLKNYVNNEYPSVNGYTLTNLSFNLIYIRNAFNSIWNSSDDSKAI